MDESILTSIKAMLGPDEDYDAFDTEIMIHINSALNILTQLGIGPDKGFRVRNANDTWDEFIPSDRDDFEMVKDYVYMKVKLIFDPPQSSAAIESLKELIREFEWRIRETAESYLVAMTKASEDVTLVDRTTNEVYELYADNGELFMGEKEAT